jgi:hypothetical protein
MNTIEQWKNVVGYENVYQISSLGNIRRIQSPYTKRSINKLLKPTDNRGYLRLPLYKDGKRERFFIHRLVAEAFIPNFSPSKTYVNHLNCNKQDNRVENLEWSTPRLNAQHYERHFIKSVIQILKDEGYEIKKTKLPK